MRLLILGGTVFLGRALAVHARAVGHDVTCAARGVSGAHPDGVRFMEIDRDRPDGCAPLNGERFDAVVDVSRHPGQVRRAVTALRRRVGHWTFVSTVTVYADNRTPGQRADTAPLRAEASPDVERGDGDAYGAAKVACERLVGPDAFICRPGLVVGPEDPTGRFTYWPVRLARGGEVLAPGTPADAVQYVDVRDLAAWIVHAAETGLVGTYDGVCAARPMGEFLSECAAAVGECTFTWVDRTFLESHDVRRWAGPRSIPLWVPLPEFGGLLSRDATAAHAAGLRVRALAETARDTLAWARAAGGSVTGLTAEEETALLRAWHAR
jgi:nucleoside-diphosphate-sugar epimerase